ncbi:hypothetical protein [Prevotella sp. HUN102]|uniref:hypothetical protein n=1 Tax=Prevotella sp. HUN102 TaxID=1392486 RepID=UPI00048B6CB9|nr:hypothetical protein [Prevotella sp. HUN102]
MDKIWVSKRAKIALHFCEECVVILRRMDCVLRLFAIRLFARVKQWCGFNGKLTSEREADERFTRGQVDKFTSKLLENVRRK